MGVKELSPFNALINQGGRHNVASMICDFADQRQLLQVNKAFRRASENSMVKVGETLLMSQPVQVRHIEDLRRQEIPDERPATEILPELFHEVETLVNDLHPHFEAHDHSRSFIFQDHWQRVVQIHDRWQGAEEGRAKETHINRLLFFLSRMKPHLAAVRAHIAAGQPFAGEGNPFIELMSEISSIITGENVANRFAAIVGARNPQNPGEIFSCLASLHESQLRGMDRATRAKFSAYTRLHPHSFSPATFRVAEVEILAAQIVKDEALRAFWSHLRPRINAGPLVDARAGDIRDWMNNEANLATLSQVQGLIILGLSQLPVEIGRCRGLKTLQCFGNNEGGLTELPEQLLNLPELRELDLRNNRFETVPEIFGRWPRGYYLNLGGNPIRLFPEVIESHRSLWKLEMDQLTSDWVRFADWIGIRPNGFDQLFLGLRGEFEEIPFRLWFKETFHIPNIPCHLGFLTAIPTVLILYLFGVDLQSTFAWICYTPHVFFSFAVGAPIFLLNVLLAAIGELVVEIRDELGYGRMIRIRDLPIEVDAPPAPAAQG